MENNDVRNHELIAIQTECREQLLAQLKANGLSPFAFYAWALARDIEAEAAEEGLPAKGLLGLEVDCQMDDPAASVRALYEEVADQLRQLGHDI